MKKKFTSLAILYTLFLILLSCSKEETADTGTIDSGGSTVEEEVSRAKSFYNSNGGNFKFRLYYAPGGNTNNNEDQWAMIYKIIESGGKISVIAEYYWVTLNLHNIGAVLNCDGEYFSTQSSNNVLIQETYKYDDYELLPNNQIGSYHHAIDGKTSYGNKGTNFIIHNPFYQGPISASSNMGYMSQFQGVFFMLSMGLNSNMGHPTFYGYNPANYSWSSNTVSQMDYTQGVLKNIPTTNDASKAGNTDRIYWAYLSFDDSPENGKINIISYDGYGFSNLTTLKGIGSIGTGLSMEYKHTITLHKNPNNLQNPYMVVRRYNTNIIDIYKFTGSAIQAVATGVTLPSTLPLNGQLNAYKEIVFSGNNVYVISGLDNKLYKLSGTNFAAVNLKFIASTDQILALESMSTGVLISIVKKINSTPKTKTVSDVVLIPN